MATVVAVIVTGRVQHRAGCKLPALGSTDKESSNGVGMSLPPLKLFASLLCGTPVGPEWPSSRPQLLGSTITWFFFYCVRMIVVGAYWSASTVGRRSLVDLCWLSLDVVAWHRLI